MERFNEKELKQVENGRKLYMVKEVRHLTESTYIISLEKKDVEFVSGQFMNIGLEDGREMREYSIYSGEKDDRLEFLIKEVEEGDVSKQLKKIMPGDFVSVDGPFGYFSLNKQDIKNNKFLFIASGTGISPFHSFMRSNSNLNYKLIHGIKTAKDSFEKGDYPKGKYISCTSRDNSGNFHGRVTDYLKKNPVDKQTLCYICGNSSMIYDVFDILRTQGVPSENVYMEVYF